MITEGTSSARGRSRGRVRIGIDIGGTFTDFAVLTPDGMVQLWKEETTPDDPTRAIDRGLSAIAKQMGTNTETLLRDTVVLVHGSTIATNTLIERSGPLVGLLCTGGFRDVLYFRDGFKWDRFNHHLVRPPDFVDRFLRLDVPERIASDGAVVIPLDEDAVRRVGQRFREAKVEAIAVAFLWSIVNPAHEIRAAEILADEVPDAAVLCSSAVLPEIREWERTSATVLSAYITREVSEYLRRFEALLGDHGYPSAPLIMQNNGGCATIPDILRRPVSVVASGPAAGPAAARAYGRELGHNDLITIDMGGTSFDVSVIRDDKVAMSRTLQVGYQPIGVPGVDVHSIGAGGGSIAWLDDGGALRVGPRSAGARPGPACYGEGGTEPTVTDANLILGYLSPRGLLAGRKPLDVALADRAIQTQIADPLTLSTTAAAAGIIRVVNANMVGGIRAVSVERGIDPRRSLLVCGGGAGGAHVASLARALQIPRVILPREASTLCAFGMAVTEVRNDYTRALHTLSVGFDEAGVLALYRDLEDEARAVAEESGVPTERLVFDRSVDARYQKQLHELTLHFADSGGEVTSENLRSLAAVFHAEHKSLYSYELQDVAVEFLHWRVTAVSPVSMAEWTPARSSPTRREASAGVVDTRPVYRTDGGTFEDTPVYDVELLAPGSSVAGPAVIEAATTTLLVHVGDVARVMGGYLLIDVARGT